jgi:hypothetical protein
MHGTGIISKENAAFGNTPEGAGMPQRWARLCIGIFILWLLMAYVAPWGRQTAMFRPMMDLIEERGIKATSYYYTDSEEFAEAETQITHSLRYPPTGPAKNKK